MGRFIGRWLWLPIFGLLVAACVIGIKLFDLDEILRNAVFLCLSCIGIA